MAKEKPTIHHSRNGVLYAKPKDIIESENGKKQLNKIRKSKLFKQIKNKSYE